MLKRRTLRGSNKYAFCASPLQLIDYQERQELKSMARERLLEMGWNSEVKEMCREAALVLIEEERFSHAALVDAVRAEASQAVPDSVRAQVLARLRSLLEGGTHDKAS